MVVQAAVVLLAAPEELVIHPPPAHLKEIMAAQAARLLPVLAVAVAAVRQRLAQTALVVAAEMAGMEPHRQSLGRL
jgi:hypothetical protein